MRKFFKYIGLILGVILSLLMSVYFLTLNDNFKKKVADRALVELNAIIKGDISLASVSGNIFDGLTLDSIVVKDGNDTIIFAEKLLIDYDLTALLNKRILVDELLVYKPILNVSKDTTAWNIANVFKLINPTSEKSSSTFPFGIFVDNIKITSATGELNTDVKSLPNKLNSLNVGGAVSYVDSQLSVRLSHLNLNTSEPNYQIEDLGLNLFYGSDGLEVDSFRIKTPRNSLEMKGDYKNKNNYKVHLNADSVNLLEYDFLLPKLYFRHLPKVDFDASFINDDLHLNVGLEQINEKIKIAAVFIGASEQSNIFTNPVYNIEATFVNVNPSHWAIEKELPVVINGNLNLQGEGFDFKKVPIVYAVNIDDAIGYGYEIANLRVNGQFKYPNVAGNVIIEDSKANAEATIVLSDIGTVNSYVFNLKVQDIKGDSFYHLNKQGIGGSFIVSANGSGFDIKELTSNIHIESDSINIRDINFNTFNSDVYIKKGTVYVDTLYLSNNDISLNTSGSYQMTETFLNANFNAEVNNAEPLYSIIQDTSIVAEVSAGGHVLGKVDSLKLSLNYVLTNAERNGMRLDTLIGNATVIISDSTSLNTSFKGINLKNKQLNIDSVRADVAYTKHLIHSNLKVFNPDTFFVEIISSVKLDTVILINTPYFVVETPILNLKNTKESMSVSIDSTALYCTDVEFKSNSSEDFYFKLDGFLNTNGYSESELTLENFKLELLRDILGIDMFEGDANIKAKLIGDSNNPEFISSLSLENVKYDWLSPSLLYFDFNIKDHYAYSNILLLDKALDSLNLGFDFPLMLDLETEQFGVEDTFPINGHLSSTQIDLHEYTYHNKHGIIVEGSTSLNFEISGTNVQPIYSGDLVLSNGLFKMDKKGINYHSINASISANNSKVKVDSLVIHSGKGNLRLDAISEIGDTSKIGKYGNLGLRILADNFLVSSDKAHDITIDANAKLESKNDSFIYSGKVDVVRSSFYLPDLTTNKSNEDLEAPLLIQALELSRIDSVGFDSGNLSTDTLDSPYDSFFRKALFGSIKIIIPKNTWIKNDLLKLEINGDIDVVKNGRIFELFGYIKVSRGSYYLYGRRFNLEGGEVTFTGGETFEPNINLSAEYVFRGADKDVQNLVLDITGTATEPELSFFIDGNSISESEAISYIIYNRSSSEIGYDNQKGLASAVSSGIMTKMVSSQLNKTLGSQLDLDMIELNTEDNFQSMDFVVGKYITKDLFMKYQRGFGENNDNEITPESITLEYELIENLFFQVQSGSSRTSGIDVTLKFERENKWKKDIEKSKDKKEK